MPGEITKDITEKIEKLVKDLNYHSYRYHVLDALHLSDLPVLTSAGFFAGRHDR
jgi:hypothetical protein